ncbi:nuclear transport factor 2 family protein [Terriglobus roseus]|uniref:SnoaL-like domain-containing protein n=1 Tax=Terriglobus roseus TaxID=392734 RepID=A0A1G7IIG6_9BACT|nr:nuclear transport factor 2 family protein [Terriglobus roseus]SDF12405.1 SnoaL-like domain-containing protein [Terriglobus roseus]
MTKQQIWNLYETYAEAWKLASSEEREQALAQIIDDSIQYLTPEFQGGREAILNDMESFRKKFPGAHFAVEDMSSHHDVALFTWALVLADGSVPAKGHDSLRLSPEGKIVSITTFPPSGPKPLP